jgi:hypothetical protein
MKKSSCTQRLQITEVRIFVLFGLDEHWAMLKHMKEFLTLLKDLLRVYWLVSDERIKHCFTLSFWLFWLVTQFLFHVLSGRHSFSGKWRRGLEPKDSNYWSRNLCGIWLGWLLSNVKAYEGVSDSYCQHVLPLKDDALWVGRCTMSSLELAIEYEDTLAVI